MSDWILGAALAAVMAVVGVQPVGAADAVTRARADIEASTWLYTSNVRLYRLKTLANGTLCGWSSGNHANGDFAIQPFVHVRGRTMLNDAAYNRHC